MVVVLDSRTPLDRLTFLLIDIRVKDDGEDTKTSSFFFSPSLISLLHDPPSPN